MSKSKSTTPGPVNRNKEIRRVLVADLVEAPWNDREHPEAQHAALDETVQHMGWYGYPDVYQREDGKLVLCDGHLRKEFLLQKYGAECEIDVNVTDFTEDEARLATATKDPISAMARHNEVKQSELIASLADNQRATVERILQGIGQNTAAAVEEVASKTQFKVIKPAPPQTWVLIGIDTMRYAEIAQQIENLSKVPDILMETVSNGES